MGIARGFTIEVTAYFFEKHWTYPHWFDTHTNKKDGQLTFRRRSNGGDIVTV